MSRKKTQKQENEVVAAPEVVTQPMESVEEIGLALGHYAPGGLLDGVDRQAREEVIDPFTLRNHPDNPRTLQEIDHGLLPLIDSICAAGYAPEEGRILVSERADGSRFILRGHRRRRALEKIRETRPQDYYRLFGSPGAKVPAKIFVGLTEQQEFALMQDHAKVSAQAPVTRYSQVCNTRKMLDRGYTGKQVAVDLGLWTESHAQSKKPVNPAQKWMTAARLPAPGLVLPDPETGKAGVCLIQEFSDAEIRLPDAKPARFRWSDDTKDLSGCITADKAAGRQFSAPNSAVMTKLREIEARSDSTATGPKPLSLRSAGDLITALPTTPGGALLARFVRSLIGQPLLGEDKSVIEPPALPAQMVQELETLLTAAIESGTGAKESTPQTAARGKKK